MGGLGLRNSQCPKRSGRVRQEQARCRNRRKGFALFRLAWTPFRRLAAGYSLSSTTGHSQKNESKCHMEISCNPPSYDAFDVYQEATPLCSMSHIQVSNWQLFRLNVQKSDSVIEYEFLLSLQALNGRRYKRLPSGVDQHVPLFLV